MLIRLTTTALVTGALLTGGAVPSHADPMSLAAKAAGPVSAEGLRTVWSAPEGSGKRRRYRLVAKFADQPPVVLRNVRSRAVPFDADIGSDARGRQSVLYSRCRKEYPFLREDTGLTGWDQSSGCRIYEYSFTRRRERQITSLGDNGSFFLPSRSGFRIAFANRSGGRVHLQSLDIRDRRVRTFRGGSTLPSGGHDDRIFTGPGPLNVDLNGRTATFLWARFPESCPADDDSRGLRFATEIWSQPLGSAGERIVQGCTTSTSLPWAVSAPTRSRSGLLYVATTRQANRLASHLLCAIGSETKNLGPTFRWNSLATSIGEVFGTVREVTGPRGLFRLPDQSCGS